MTHKWTHYVNESWHTHECITSISHGTHMKALHQWVLTHIRIYHVTESWRTHTHTHTHKCIMSMRHGTHMNASRQWVMTHTWIHYVTPAGAWSSDPLNSRQKNSEKMFRLSRQWVMEHTWICYITPAGALSRDRCCCRPIEFAPKVLRETVPTAWLFFVSFCLFFPSATHDK